MTTLEPLPQPVSNQMELPGLTLSPAGSPAKTYRSPADARALKVLGADYGQRSSVWLANYDPHSSSWRTSQICLVALASNRGNGLAEFSETWPRAGMMRNGTAYQQPLSELHILVTGSGSWPTPNKSNGFAPFSMLTMHRKALGLSRPSGAKMGFDLKWEPRSVPYLVDGWINPILSEWLMGFPIGHTALPPAETP
jgi:hypothetical protein